MTSTQPRTQRKRAANAPLHTKRIMASSHLAPEIHDKSKAHLPRALPVRKGDTVRIMRGGFRGKEGKVVSVDRVHGTVVIEGITIEKVDEKKVARPRRPRGRPRGHGSEIPGRPHGRPLVRGDEGPLPDARRHARPDGPRADRGGRCEVEAVPRRGQDDGPPGQDAGEPP